VKIPLAFFSRGSGTGGGAPVDRPVFAPAAPGDGIEHTITITCATEGATIIYTLDGSTPSATNGVTYTMPVDIFTGIPTSYGPLFSNYLLKAIGVKAGRQASPVRMGEYGYHADPFVPPASVSLIPVMTDYTMPSGVASASSELGGSWPAWKAFDGRGLEHGSYDFWAGADGDHVPWIQYQSTSAIAPTSYRLTPINDTILGGLTRNPSAWQLQGSNDGAAWTTLDSQSGITDWAVNTPKTFACAANPYTFHRLLMSANGFSNSSYELSQMELLA